MTSYFLLRPSLPTIWYSLTVSSPVISFNLGVDFLRSYDMIGVFKLSQSSDLQGFIGADLCRRTHFALKVIGSEGSFLSSPTISYAFDDYNRQNPLCYRIRDVIRIWRCTEGMVKMTHPIILFLIQKSFSFCRSLHQFTIN